MDELIDHFRKVYRLESSPVDIVNELATCCPNKVKLMTVPLGGNLESTIYSSIICIENDRSFVANDRCQLKATEKASFQAVEYLKEISKIEQICLDDEEYLQVMVALKNLGYSIEYENNSSVNPTTFDLIYHKKIKIPGLGDFIGESECSIDDALKEAAEKLKYFYTQTLALNIFSVALPIIELPLVDVQNDELQVVKNNEPELVFNFPFEPFTEAGNLQSPGKSYQEHPQPDLLSPVDRKWIELINRFNLENAQEPNPVTIMNKLIEADVHISINTVSFSTKDTFKLYNLYKSTLNLVNLKSFCSTTKFQMLSQDNVKKSSFNFLIKVSKLLSTFKSVYYEAKNPDEVMEEILKQSNNMIKCKSLPKPDFGFQTKINIICFNVNFLGDGFDVIESRTEAFIQTIDYLKSLTNEIHDIPQKQQQLVHQPNEIKNAKPRTFVNQNLPSLLPSPPQTECDEQESNYLLPKPNLFHQNVFCRSTTPPFSSHNVRPIQTGPQLQNSPPRSTFEYNRNEWHPSRFHYNQQNIRASPRPFYRHPVEPIQTSSPLQNSSAQEKFDFDGHVQNIQQSNYFWPRPNRFHQNRQNIRTWSPPVNRHAFEPIQMLKTPISWSSSLTPALRDYQLIELINRFHAVYHPTKLPIDIMDELIQSDRHIFEIKSNSRVTSKESLYETTVKHIELGLTFYGMDKCQTQSRHNALIQPFDYLMKLSKLFTNFKTIYAPNKSISSYMTIFIAQNAEIISIQVGPDSKLGYEARISLASNWKQFSASADTEDNARMEAFSKMVDYLQMYSCRIHEVIIAYPNNPILANNRFNKPQNQQASKPYQQTLVQYGSNNSRQFRDTRPYSPRTFNEDCTKTMELIIRFSSVYADVKQPIIIMKELIEKDPSAFEFAHKEVIKTIKVQGEEKDVQQIETILKIDNFTRLTTIDETEEDSRNRALMLAYWRLKNLWELFETFNSEIYSPNKNTSELIAQLLVRFEEVIKVKSRKTPGSPQTHRTTVTLVHFHDMHGDNANKQISEEIAFKRMIDYIRTLCERFRQEKAKAETKISSIESSSGHYEMDDSQSMTGTVYSTELGLEMVEKISKENINKQVKSENLTEPSSDTDQSIEKAIKIINDFNQVFDFDKSAQENLEKINDLNKATTFTISTKAVPEGFVAKVDLIGIGNFHSSGETMPECMNESAQKAIDFIEDLLKLIRNFKFVYSPNASPLSIIDQLKEDNTEILTLSSKVEANKFCTRIDLKNLCSFAKLEDTEENSKREASVKAVEYLHKLADGIVEDSFL